MNAHAWLEVIMTLPDGTATLSYSSYQETHQCHYYNTPHTFFSNKAFSFNIVLWLCLNPL